jgi:hypothetical protein
MCVPVAALAVGSIIASVAGSAMQGYSQYQYANYQAQVARNNQVIANQNASLALQQGQRAEETQRLRTGQLMGNIEAQQGASGVVGTSGSSLNVRSSAAETGELDAETIRYNANLSARNFMYQGQMAGAQAGLYSSMGEWGVANSLLGGASSVSSKWLSYQQSGIFGNQPSNPAMGGN